MMRTLFLQAPSFEGFDGGAGSRYQARREIRSFWYPTWLAQPAALVENVEADRCPAARTEASTTSLPLARELRPRRPSHLDAVFASDVKTVEAMKEVNPSLKAGFIGANVAVEPEGSLKASPAIDFVGAQRVRLHHQGRRRRAGLGARSPGCPTATTKARSSTTPNAPILENMDALPFVTPVYKRDLDDRELFHRLSQAPLRLALHRPRLQIALHLLPLAADRRRPSLPHAQRRTMSSRRCAGRRTLSRR